MMKLFYKFIIFIYAAGVLAFISIPVSAQQETLDLETYIELASANNLKFREILMDELYLQYKSLIDLPEDKYSLSFESGYSYAPDIAPGLEASGPESRISLEKLFPATGSSASLSYQTSPGRIDRSSAVSAVFSQDIAKNAFGKSYTLEKEKITSLNSIAEYQVVEAYEDFLSSLIKEYYSWVSIYENLKTAQISYNESLRLLENMESRRANRIAGEGDVYQIRLLVLDRQESLKNLEKSHNAAVRKIRQTAGISAGLYPDPVPVLTPLNMLPEGEFKEIFESVKSGSRTFTILEEFTKSGITAVEIRKRNLMPSIALNAGFNYSGTGYLPGEEPEKSLSIGITLTRAFPAARDRALLETAEIDYKKTLLQNGIKKENIEAMLHDLYEDIIKTGELLEINRQKLELSGLILKEETQNYSIGRSTLRSYTDAINSLESVRYRNQYYKTQLNTYIIEWLRLTDSLVKRDFTLDNRVKIMTDDIIE